jgi:hypothetical protein
VDATLLVDLAEAATCGVEAEDIALMLGDLDGGQVGEDLGEGSA